MTSKILSLKNIEIQYAGRSIQNNISFDFAGHTIYGIAGSNGVGKTSLLNVIGGITQATSGTIYLNDVDITEMGPTQIAQQGIARVFQEPRIFDGLSVLDNVVVAKSLGRYESLRSSVLGPMSWRAADIYARQSSRLALERVNLVHKCGDPAATLSYGQKRLLGAARVMLRRYHCVLMDEPSTGLDDEAKRTLCDVIKEFRNTGAIVIVVEHDPEFLSQIADEIVHLTQDGLQRRTEENSDTLDHR